MSHARGPRPPFRSKTPRGSRQAAAQHTRICSATAKFGARWEEALYPRLPYIAIGQSAVAIPSAPTTGHHARSCLFCRPTRLQRVCDIFDAPETMRYLNPVALPVRAPIGHWPDARVGRAKARALTRTCSANERIAVNALVVQSGEHGSVACLARAPAHRPIREAITPRCLFPRTIVSQAAPLANACAQRARHDGAIGSRQ